MSQDQDTGTMLEPRIESPRPPRLTSARKVAKNSFLSLCGELWTLMVVLLAMPVVVRTLGQEGFGLFSLAWVVLGYMAILDFGVSRAATKYISEHLSREEAESVERVSRAAITSNLVLGAVGAVAMFAVTPWITRAIFHFPEQLQAEARTIFTALVISIPVLLIQSVLRAILSSFQRFGWISILNSLAITLQWGSACVLALLGYRVAAIVIVCVIARAAITGAYAIVLGGIDKRLLGLGLGNVSDLWRLWRFGSWVTVSQVMTPILLYLDRILVASLISLEAMTFYVIPYEVITRLRIVPASLVNSLFPSLSERNSTLSRNSLVWLYGESLKYLLLILLPCFVLLATLGPDIIGVWVGAEYARWGGQVLRILAAGALLNSLSYVPYAALLALGRPDLPAKFHVAELVLYVGLAFALIARWGIVGAAWAVTLRMAGDAIALFWAAAKYLSWTTALHVSLRPILLNLGFTSMLIIVGSFSDPLSLRLAVGALCSIVYSVVVWFLVLEKRERPSLWRLVN